MTNVQKILEKVRPPRIQITYDVETEGASVKKQLPFVVGIMGDYSGNSPSIAKEPYANRPFVEIGPDNFNHVMEQMGPGLSFQVPDTIKGGGNYMDVNLKFESMDDFEPYNVAQQVPELADLLTTRLCLKDLLIKADQFENLEVLLEQVLQNSSDVKALTKLLGTKAGS